MCTATGRIYNFCAHTLSDTPAVYMVKRPQTAHVTVVNIYIEGVSDRPTRRNVRANPYMKFIGPNISASK